MVEDVRARTVVVDDDPDTRFLITRALEQTGRFDVVAHAADGDVAVDVARDCQPDLVLLDLNMPRVDGLVALPRVRAVCPPDTLLVVISGRRTTEAAQEAARGGAAFIEKSPGYQQFAEELRDLIESSAAVGSAASFAQWHLPPELTSGKLARQRLREALIEWQAADLLDEAELLATELVNNAVVHAASDVLVTAKLGARVLRVEVSDYGVGTPHRPQTDLEDTHGRGLMLVEALSDDWGTRVAGATKTVWFELASAASPTG